MNLGFPLFPDTASASAGRVDALFFFLLALTGSVTLLIGLLIAVFVVRYRRRDDRRPRQVRDSTSLEIAWTVIPAVVFLIPFVWGARLYIDLYRPAEDAVEIHGLGTQWMWKFEHPGGQREIDSLHVPANRAVRLILTSQDVIHSFFVPAFRTKQDVVPGRYTTVSFVATRPGRYHLFCAEYCGMDHSVMRGSVTVLEPRAYERWLAHGASGSAASEGAKLFQHLGCALCHRDDSLRRAPVLAGLFGRPVHLASGDVVLADENYLRESILDPGAKVVYGWQPIMPSYRDRMGEDELFQLLAYIKSLAAAAPVTDTAAAPPPPPRGPGVPERTP